MGAPKTKLEKLRSITLPPDLEASAPLLNEIDEGLICTAEVHDKIYSFAYKCLQHMQDTKQNLSTTEFLDFLLDKLKISAIDCFFHDVNYVLMEVANHHFDEEQYSRLKVNNAELDDLIYKWLYFNQDYCPELYRNKIAVLMDNPTTSILDPKKITVWGDTRAMMDFNKRKTMSVREWIKSTLVGLSDEQVEDLIEWVDVALTPIDEIDIRFHDSFDFLGWADAYHSEEIDDVMSTHSGSEVGRENTFTCFCSGYHGLPDNGLKLAVLYQDNIPIARAITFAEGSLDCYNDCYGDDRLLKWLKINGYYLFDLPEGTILYSNSYMLKPDIEGDLCLAKHCCTPNGIYYWEVSKDGRYNLCNSKAWAKELVKCDCCGGDFDEGLDEIGSTKSAADGEYYNVCDDCYGDNTFDICCEWGLKPFFFHNGDKPTDYASIVEYKGTYYQRHFMDKYGLVEMEGEIYRADDLYYCELTYKYFKERDDVLCTADDVSKEQKVYFPYKCVSRKHWDENVIECSCGTLALKKNAAEVADDNLGQVIIPEKNWKFCRVKDEFKCWHGIFIFDLPLIESDYKDNPSDQTRAVLDFARAYNENLPLQFQEIQEMDSMDAERCMANAKLGFRAVARFRVCGARDHGR